MGWLSAAADEAGVLPLHPLSPLLLFGCCQNEHDCARLGLLLKMKIPMEPEAIKATIANRIKLGRPYNTMPLPLIAIPSFQGSYFNPLTPGIVFICHIRDGAEAFARWLPAAQGAGPLQNAGIPPFKKPDDTGNQGAPEFLTIDDLLQKVAGDFVIIAPLEYE
jgi:hypothetical protein